MQEMRDRENALVLMQINMYSTFSLNLDVNANTNAVDAMSFYILFSYSM